MPSLPTVGGDKGTWAQKLVDFLGVGHNSDGTLKGVGNPSVTVATTSLTLTDDHDVVIADTTAGDVFVTLPTAVGRVGKQFTIIHKGSYDATRHGYVAPQAGETISTQKNYWLKGEGESIQVVSDGANWHRFAIPSFRSQNEWYVAWNIGVDTGDGRSPQTAFQYLEDAISAASSGDTIYVFGTGTILPAGGIVCDGKTLRIVGVGSAITLTANSADTALDDIAFHVKNIGSAGWVIENITFKGHSNFKGVLYLEEQVANGRLMNVNFSGAGVTPDFHPLATDYYAGGAAGTGAAGIGFAKHGGEGNYYENIRISGLSIGLATGDECSANHLHRVTVTGCVQEWVSGMWFGSGLNGQPLQPYASWAYSGGNGGGWKVTMYKSVAPVVLDHSPLVPTVEFHSGHYIDEMDASEGTYFSETRHPHVRFRARCVLDRCTSAPAAVWEVMDTAGWFEARDIRILGSGWLVWADDCLFDGGLSNGMLQFNGSRNKARKLSFSRPTGAPMGIGDAMQGSDNEFDDCQFYDYNAVKWDNSYLGTNPRFPSPPQVRTLTYGATIAVDVRYGTHFTVDATNGTAFAISNPTYSADQNGSIMPTKTITFDIKNSSGGAMGSITWGNKFLLAGAFTNPANGKRRTITFQFDGTNWVEVYRSAADI